MSLSENEYWEGDGFSKDVTFEKILRGTGESRTFWRGDRALERNTSDSSSYAEDINKILLLLGLQIYMC